MTGLREQFETGKTVDEAIEKACLALGVPREDTQFEIINLPKKTGFLGLKFIPAKVRVFIEKTKRELALEFLNDLIKKMGYNDFHIDVTQEENNVIFNLEGDEVGNLIGRHGETLDSLQYITGLYVNKFDGDYFRVTLNSGDYRAKREKTLEVLARKVSFEVVKTGRPISLEAMTPYERRVIHAAVGNIRGVSSISQGDEPNRHIVISPTNPINNKKPAVPKVMFRPNLNKPRTEENSSVKTIPEPPKSPIQPNPETPKDAVVDVPLYSKITQ